MAHASFAVSQHELPFIHAIVKRAVREGLVGPKSDDKMSLEMDLMATHANGCPIDFKRFAEADSFNFAHDVYGIMRHIDRRTGYLGNHFTPRFAARQVAEASR
jgi:hypothetical protein